MRYNFNDKSFEWVEETASFGGAWVETRNYYSSSGGPRVGSLTHVELDDGRKTRYPSHH
ncbi:MAG: hypothetical protein ACRESZ_15985 [Methylococcales bacterium]